MKRFFWTWCNKPARPWVARRNTELGFVHVHCRWFDCTLIYGSPP